MLTSHRAFQHTIKRVLPNDFIFLKQISTTLSASSTSHADSHDKSPQTESQRVSKVTKTKKKYQDLPVAHVLPDGTIAEPLKEWNTGCHLGTANTSLSAELTSVKKGRKTKKYASLDVAPPQTRKRVRKKTKKESPNTLEQSDSVEGSINNNQPRNFLAREILENLNKFPHCLLLTRVGQFYESYFDQAIEIARLLNIKLTSRKWDSRQISMCGFPLMHIDKYLKILVQQNKRFVAMCEEFPRYSSSGSKEFDRRVVRIVTPGTLIDETFLNPYENNYLLSIYTSETAAVSGQVKVGLAWIDVSTGEFFTKASNIQSLRDEIARIGPKEIVLDKSLRLTVDHPISQALAEENNVISHIMLEGAGSSTEKGFQILEQIGISQDPKGGTISDELASANQADLYSPEETSAIQLLSSYLRANLLEHMPQLGFPNREQADSRMHIDAHTIKALEIRERIHDGGTTGSLLSVVKKTVTSSGTRLLSRWLCSPSCSIPEINARQSLVSFFYKRPHFRMDLRQLFIKAEDPIRILQKFLLNRGDSSDFITISTAINVWTDLQRRVKEEARQENENGGLIGEWECLDNLMSRMTNLTDIWRRIELATEKISADTESTTLAQESQALKSAETERLSPVKWRINPNFSDELKRHHSDLQNLFKQKEALESTLQKQFNTPSLTLRSSPSQGMHVHLAKAKRDRVNLDKNNEFVPLSESNTTKSYFYQKWSVLGSQIYEASVTLLNAEKEAFETLRCEVVGHANSFRRNSRILDELDVTIAFASLASEMNFIQPVLHDGVTYDVTNGRHPAVELGLLTSGRPFTANNVKMDPSSQVHIITGPNMAGKSTLLRQTALISILAQAGSFVPADSAELGIVDKLFSRVGAKDDLFHNRSTFMVEMLETAEILNRATPQSLVIMDEIGRGTTVKDGLAIAFATLHHLVTVNRCRVLFATHFHEISDMVGNTGTSHGQGIFEPVSFFCTTVQETDDGNFTYSYRMQPGVNRNSHGLKVAQLAGFPKGAMEIAKMTLTELEQMSMTAKFAIPLWTKFQSATLKNPYIPNPS